MIPAALLLINSFFKKKINYFHCVFAERFAKLFHTILTSVYVMHIFTFINDGIVGIEKRDGKCSFFTFVNDFPGLFLHPSIFSFKHSRSA